MRRRSPRDLTRFATTIALAAALAATTRVSTAQSVPTPVASDSARALVGTWEGTYDSDHAGTGGMKLVIAKDSVLRATALSIAIGGEMQSVPVHDLVVTTDDITWIQDTMGMPCQATAVLKAGKMKGSVVCGHGQISFTLSKRS